ncbi:MAG: hypothetical protein I8H75_02595 [Myxococcaceae bacterium]|nr:hypothetical protein [Myxococcaceae bacterium]MBH2006225.1 hypothetical protein [Myxococcaceae bacterium]
MVPVYAPSNEIEGQRIVRFLISERVAAMLEVSSPLPQPLEWHTLRILAPEKQRPKAIELIATARLDQVIADNGMFL